MSAHVLTCCRVILTVLEWLPGTMWGWDDGLTSQKSLPNLLIQGRAANRGSTASLKLTLYISSGVSVQQHLCVFGIYKCLGEQLALAKHPSSTHSSVVLLYFKFGFHFV